MESTLRHLIENNRQWAARIQTQDPGFFEKLSHQQSPQYLWVGCSDSRVPANEIIGLLPGEIFVHRNVGNLVVHTDLNCLAVIQYAVDVLHVRHIIVCGHYGCGGVNAVIQKAELGLIDNWLRHIKDVYEKHQNMVDAATDAAVQSDRLCALNVVEQVYNVCHTTIVQNAWKRDQPVSVHGWIYRLTDGLIRDLNATVAAPDEAATQYRRALEKISKG